MKNKVFRAVLMFIIAAISLTIGIVIIPEVTKFGKTVLHILIGVLLLVYCYGYLLPKVVKKAKNTILVLSLIELILLTFVAVTCIIETWVQMTFLTEGCLIIGVALWIRGVVESFRSYFYQKNSANKYPVYKVILNVILITVGTWFYVSPIISNFELLYVFSFLLIAVSVALIVMGILKLKK